MIILINIIPSYHYIIHNIISYYCFLFLPGIGGVGREHQTAGA